MCPIQQDSLLLLLLMMMFCWFVMFFEMELNSKRNLFQQRVGGAVIQFRLIIPPGSSCVCNWLQLQLLVMSTCWSDTKIPQVPPGGLEQLNHLRKTPKVVDWFFGVSWELFFLFHLFFFRPRNVWICRPLLPARGCFFFNPNRAKSNKNFSWFLSFRP